MPGLSGRDGRLLGDGVGTIGAVALEAGLDQLVERDALEDSSRLLDDDVA